MPERFASFRPLFDAFHGAGHQLYMVGGCVRDVVMGLDRVGDVDLATDALPDATRRVLEDAGFRAYPIGERFGTITTLVDAATVEITTFRVGEVYERGSRHPHVEFGTHIEADLARRDLSMNAMAMDHEGTIIDPFDGRAAIRRRELEVPGGGYDNTISILRDDPLRLLRIARFAARFGFLPTNDTTRAARVTAPELVHISHERWKMEMDKLLVGPQVGVGLTWLHDVGALPVVLPGAAHLDDADVGRTAARIHSSPTDPLTRWAVLVVSCLDRGPGGDAATAATDTANRFRFSNRERRSLINRVALAPPPADAWTDARLRRLYAAAPDDALAWLDVRRAMADEDRRIADGFMAARARLEGILATGDPTPVLPSGLGSRLARRFDLTGPEIGAAIERIREAILDGDLPNAAPPDTYVEFMARALGASPATPR